MASIKDVAKKANVSTATVSHVINGTRFVSAETKGKVFQAMLELDYRPNSVARSLRSKRSKIIGLLVPILPHDTSNFFFMSVAQGIESVLKEHGYNMILSNSKEDLQTEQEQIKVFNSQLIDGLIIAPTFEDHEYLDMLTDKYPVVFIDRKPRGAHRDCVLTDGCGGTYEAIKYLISKGHKRIGFITGSLGLTTSDERFDGYKRALTDHGLEVDMNLVQIASSSYSSFDSGRNFAEILVDHQQVTALFVANNVMTMGVLYYLQERGLCIPDDVALIGFDDYEWARITQPALSMVKQPSFELGETAARILLKRIEEFDLKSENENPTRNRKFEEHRLPTKFILRNSC